MSRTKVTDLPQSNPSRMERRGEQGTNQMRQPWKGRVRSLMEAQGQVCERRALPAGTGAKAHPGQMAAPETRWATGHQPSCPRATMGRAQRQAV